MCFQVYLNLGHRLKGNWSLRRRQRLPLHYIKLPILRRRPKQLSVFGIIFTHSLFAKGEKVVTRAYISLKYPFLAIHAKGGESISPKQKDRTTTNFQNLKLTKGFEMMNFSIGILFLIEIQIGSPSSKTNI
jgi:hypothetical protein